MALGADSGRGLGGHPRVGGSLFKKETHCVLQGHLRRPRGVCGPVTDQKKKGIHTPTGALGLLPVVMV